jgi:hypothetical protein
MRLGEVGPQTYGLAQLGHRFGQLTILFRNCSRSPLAMVQRVESKLYAERPDLTRESVREAALFVCLLHPDRDPADLSPLALLRIEQLRLVRGVGGSVGYAPLEAATPEQSKAFVAA